LVGQLHEDDERQSKKKKLTEEGLGLTDLELFVDSVLCLTGSDLSTTGEVDSDDTQVGATNIQSQVRADLYYFFYFFIINTKKDNVHHQDKKRWKEVDKKDTFLVLVFRCLRVQETKRIPRVQRKFYDKNTNNTDRQTDRKTDRRHRQTTQT
jgi:hypothetical protein